MEREAPFSVLFLLLLLLLFEVTILNKIATCFLSLVKKNPGDSVLRLDLYVVEGFMEISKITIISAFNLASYETDFILLSINIGWE